MSDSRTKVAASSGEATATGPADSKTADRRYWRGLDDLAQTPEFLDALHREFPDGAAEHSGLNDPVSRRRFVGVVAASVALAGMTSCRKPHREILPYTTRPQGLIPGIPQHYATAHGRFGYGIGTLVRSNDGRPTKVEGNPTHPASGGGADAWMQAEILQLYDPSRSRHVLHKGSAHQPPKPDSGDAEHGAEAHGADHGDPYRFQDFLDVWSPKIHDLATNGGNGVHILMPPTSSPTMGSLIEELKVSVGAGASIHHWAPVNRDNVLAGSEVLYGRYADGGGEPQPLEPLYDFSKADVVAAFDCDFLGADAPSLQWTRGWAERRKVRGAGDKPARLYAAEATMTVTGSNADHRYRVPSTKIAEIVVGLMLELKAGPPSLRNTLRDRTTPAWIQSLAKDLQANRGRACVVVGPRQPAAVHAAAGIVNAALNSVSGDGSTPVSYVPAPVGVAADCTAGIRELTEAMSAGRVEALVCIGVNPVYDAPADLEFGEAFARLSESKLTVHCGTAVDETARMATWHVPMCHELESWGDLHAVDGTATIVQPLVEPLYEDARSPIELVAAVMEHPVTEGYELVRATWEQHPARQGQSFDAFWRKSLHDGLIAGTSRSRVAVGAVNETAVNAAVLALATPPAPSASALEINFRAHPSVFDGRYANNAWMQELPTPIEKLTWDNAVLMSRATAKELGVYNEDLVDVAFDGRTVQGAVWIQPGHVDHAITLYLGYGRQLGSEHEVAAGCGFDAGRLRTTAAMHFGSGATVKKAGGTYALATTQSHGVMEGRPLVREATLAEFEQNPNFAPELSPAAKAAALMHPEGGDHVEEKNLLKSLWNERSIYADGHQWGMVIDLNSCTGCGACVAACVAENNIMTVGKQQVLVGREMHWNRVDRYFTTDTLPSDEQAGHDGVPYADDPQVVHQMVPCMQCENAPCESVCPVGATMHSPEGLNDMVYNRCIGTRYCNNNCPYKVRRFNWFDFVGDVPQSEQMAFNPDVTVRHRGVMEKCTYCVQRINAGKFAAKLEERPLRDGEIKTACEQGCPADAITFGDVNDPESRVTQLRGKLNRETLEVEVPGSPLNYAMLSEYNLKPRTTYLAKVRNPNPELS